MTLKWGWFFPGYIWQGLEMFLVITTRVGVYGERPGMLLNILQHSRQSPQQRVIWSRMLGVEMCEPRPWVKSRPITYFHSMLHFSWRAPITIMSIFTYAKVLAKFHLLSLMRWINKLNSLAWVYLYISNSHAQPQTQSLEFGSENIWRDTKYSGQGWAVLSRALSACLGLQLRGILCATWRQSFPCPGPASATLLQHLALCSSAHPSNPVSTQVVPQAPSSQWICPRHLVKLVAPPVKFIWQPHHYSPSTDRVPCAAHPHPPVPSTQLRHQAPALALSLSPCQALRDITFSSAHLRRQQACIISWLKPPSGLLTAHSVEPKFLAWSKTLHPPRSASSPKHKHDQALTFKIKLTEFLRNRIWRWQKQGTNDAYYPIMSKGDFTNEKYFTSTSQMSSHIGGL